LTKLTVLHASNGPNVRTDGGVFARGSSPRSPFNARVRGRCYANAPFALLISLATTVWQYPNTIAQTVAAAVIVLSTFAFLAIETAWFGKALGVGPSAGVWNALVSYVGAGAFMIALGWLVGGPW